MLPKSVTEKKHCTGGSEEHIKRNFILFHLFFLSSAIQKHIFRCLWPEKRTNLFYVSQSYDIIYELLLFLTIKALISVHFGIELCNSSGLPLSTPGNKHVAEFWIQWGLK